MKSLQSNYSAWWLEGLVCSSLCRLHCSGQFFQLDVDGSIISNWNKVKRVEWMCLQCNQEDSARQRRWKSERKGHWCLLPNTLWRFTFWQEFPRQELLKVHFWSNNGYSLVSMLNLPIHLQLQCLAHSQYWWQVLQQGHNHALPLSYLSTIRNIPCSLGGWRRAILVPAEFEHGTAVNMIHTLWDALWAVDGHNHTLAEHSCKIPEVFHHFTALQPARIIQALKW